MSASLASSRYSTAHARRSLVHFLVGKTASALAGVSYLVLLVRHMEAPQYGAYITLVAFTEIFYLSTGLGLSTIAQRYVTEYRLKASANRFHHFLRSLFLRRLGLSLLFSVLLLVGQGWLLMTLGLEHRSTFIVFIVALMILTASVFFLEEVLGALLFQGISQGLGVMRGLLKLAAIGFVIQHTGRVTIEWVLMQECTIALLSLLLGHAILFARLRAGADGQGDDAYANPGMAATARRFYAVQLIGQTYAPSVSKLLVTRLLGLAHTAAFGFAQSIADMLRNYLPAHLLAGWLRPIMVSRYLARRDIRDLADMANLVLKLNLLGIVPLAAFFLLRGDAFGTWLTAGRYTHAGSLLVLLTLMVGLQTVHLMFAMITITLEQAGANLRATMVAAASLPLSIGLIHWFGITGAACGLLGSEALWLLTAGWLLARRGFHIAWDIGGALRIWLAGAVAAGALWLSGLERPVLAHMAGSAAIVGLMFLLSSALLKPLRERERALARGVMPARFVLW